MAVPPPPSAAAAGGKPALRRALRAARAAHVAALTARHEIKGALHAAAARVMGHVPAGAVVALYHPLIDEMDPMCLADALLARGHGMALPHVAGDGTTMRFLAWSPGQPLVPGIFGLSQPAADCAQVSPALIVTPLLGFDRSGGRIGQGAGYYDRAFAALPGARRIGYAWSVQEVAAVPLDPWDVPLHAVATEREWIAIEGPNA